MRLFCTKLFQFIEKGAMNKMPTHLAIIFDKSENSFRKELYPPYKANRSEPPEDLVPQFPLMREAVRAFGLIPIEQDKYEADDLIATYAKEARERGADVLIISADKDLMQLIEPGVCMYDPASGERDERYFSEAEVLEYFGVPPEKVVDVQSLAGDFHRQRAGRAGHRHQDRRAAHQRIWRPRNIVGARGRDQAAQARETLTNPRLSRRSGSRNSSLTLVRDVPLATALDDLGLSAPEGKALVAFLKAMEFSTITKRAAEKFSVEANEIDADPRLVGPGGWRARNGEQHEDADKLSAAPSPAPAAERPATNGPKQNARYGDNTAPASVDSGPGVFAAARAASLRTLPSM